MTRRALLISLAAAIAVLQPAIVHGQTAAPLIADAAAHPLVALERHRSSVVQRIVSEWAGELAVLPGDRRLTRQQLSDALWALRSDRLLAASLAGSSTAIEAILAEDRDDRNGVLQVAAKSLGDAAADLTYTPINPCRIVDSRNVGGPLLANAQRTFAGFSSNFSTQGGTAGNCALPNGVAAIAMNVYAVNPSNLGFIKVWGANGAEPAVSTVNYQSGTVAIATGAIVPVDSANSNRFIAKSPAVVDFIVDAVGYFKAPGDATGLNILAHGQRVMRYEFNATSPNVIGGHPGNSASVNPGQTIAGGGAAGSTCYDPATAAFNHACANQAGGPYATVGGGIGNTAMDYATVAGGQTSLAGDVAATVGGGFRNRASATEATVAGGALNQADGTGSTIGGGQFNNATGSYATVAGGNSNTASGAESTVIGGFLNVASGSASLAGGTSAVAGQAGCFVWADASTFNPVNCGSPNEIVGRALGGVFFLTAGTTDATYTGAELLPGATSWTTYSDRNGKDNVEPVDPKAVLTLLSSIPVATWNWKSQAATIRHMGPMAQDFAAAFHLGETNRGINTVDSEGVALAAIQGLHQLVQEKDALIQSQAHEIGDLRERVMRMESLRDEMAALKSALEALVGTRAAMGAH